MPSFKEGCTGSGMGIPKGPTNLTTGCTMG
jgi:hypothetical protein